MIPVDCSRLLADNGLSDNYEITMVAGDASDRTFWRISFQEPSAMCGRTAVLMSYGTDKSSGGMDVFLDVQKAMHAARLPVPEIFCSDRAEGFVLMEDFGDDMLESIVAKGSESEILSMYKKAVDLIVKIQVAGEGRMDPDCGAFFLAFDVEKFMFEFNFFYEHAVLGLKKVEPSDGDKAIIFNGFNHIAEYLSGQKRFMTHRDYHSRNLMVTNGELGMVDFQDARMGPRQYDLVSLLHDSYVQISGNMVATLYDYYISSSADAGLPVGDSIESFEKAYLYMTVQRSIKAAGSFAYLDTVKGKSRYMQYFPTVLGYAKTALLKLDGMEEFYDTLSKYFLELK